MRFIFVGGCGRSGTTLVQKILLMHSDIVGGPEFDFSNEIMSLYKNMSMPFHLERQQFFYDKDVLKKSFINFYSSFFEPVRKANKEALFLSEKTPNNIQVADTLLDLFQDAFFINVSRDGRDVIVSHKEVKKRYEENGNNVDDAFAIERICQTWNEAINKYYSLLDSKQFNERIYNICYEKLVTNPEEEIKKLFKFLDLNYEEKLLHPEDLIPSDKRAVIDDIWYTQNQYKQAINPNKIGRWKKELTILEKRKATKLMRHNLIKLGYLS